VYECIVRACVYVESECTHMYVCDMCVSHNESERTKEV